jgi:anionic cell wall polymer biosynthesis LytR-Cps2A-Psr (LCP) family protein
LTDPDDPFDLGYFPKGEHHFDGETAIRFARIRMMDNDYYRTKRQSMILQALWKKIISQSILPHIPRMITIINDSVQMNFEPKDIRQLICLAPLLTDETLQFVNVPLDMLIGERVYVNRYEKTLFFYKVEEAAFDKLIRDFQRGRWP